MTDLNFEKYMKENLLSLDRLVSLYVNKKNELMQSYWENLRSMARPPEGFKSCSSGNEKISAHGEHYFGWQIQKEIFGESKSVKICVGVSSDPSRDFSKWQFMNQFWTGIQIKTSKNLTSKISEFAKSLSIDPKQWGDWVLYQDWDPIANSDLFHLFEKLTSKDKEADQKAIIDQLMTWKNIVDQIPSI
jgi:hypothetical protein